MALPSEFSDHRVDAVRSQRCQLFLNAFCLFSLSTSYGNLKCRPDYVDEEPSPIIELEQRLAWPVANNFVDRLAMQECCSPDGFRS